MKNLITQTRGFYNFLMNLIESLMSSTDVNVQFKNESIEFGNRNSMSNVKSTIGIDSFGGHNVSELIIIENQRYRLFIAPAEDRFSGQCEVAHLQSFKIRRMLECPAEAPLWLKKSSVVAVATENRFSGFDEEGRPTFHGSGRVLVKDTETVNYKTRDIWKSFKFEPEAEGIGCQIDKRFYFEGDQIDGDQIDFLPPQWDTSACANPDECLNPEEDDCPAYCKFYNERKVVFVKDEQDGPKPSPCRNCRDRWETTRPACKYCPNNY